MSAAATTCTPTLPALTDGEHSPVRYRDGRWWHLHWLPTLGIAVPRSGRPDFAAHGFRFGALPTLAELAATRPR